MGQPGLTGRLDPSAITAMVGSNSLSEWEVFNPLVQTCLTIRGFETQGLDLQRPTWLPRLQAGGQGWLWRRVPFLRAWAVQKGHPSWGPVLSGGTEGPEDGSKMGRRGSTLGSRATSPLHTASGLTPQTQVPLAVCHQGCPHTALGASPRGCVPPYRGNWRPNLAFSAGKATFPRCMCNIPAFVESLFLCPSALVSPRSLGA